MKLHAIRKPVYKKLIIAAVIIVIATLGWLYYSHHFQKWPFLPTAAATSPANTVNYNKPTDSQTSAGTAIKQQVADQAKDSGASSLNSSTSPTVVIDITSANKTASTLAIRTLVQKVTSTGTCSLVMNGPNGATYSATVGVQALASSSTCRGFDVPLSGLSSGAWSITINFKDDTDTATTTKEMTI